MKCNQEQWDAIKGKLVGVEIEKIFKGSELQSRSEGGKWVVCLGYEYRLKLDYSAEIAELERQIEILKNK